MSDGKMIDGASARRAIGAGAAATSGTSLIAAIASFCCVGPWAVMLFGVPGAIFIARWEPYRPTLIVASGALLGWSFWRTYRLRQACAAGTCASGPSPWLIATLWIAAALWLFALVAPYVADLIARSALPQGGSS
jgi:mercuric ion transport protein